MYVHVCFYTRVFGLRPLLFPCDGLGAWALSSECKTDQILQIGCPSYHLTSWRKSALTKKLLAQIPKAFHQHLNTEMII